MLNTSVESVRAKEIAVPTGIALVCKTEFPASPSLAAICHVTCQILFLC